MTIETSGAHSLSLPNKVTRRVQIIDAYILLLLVKQNKNKKQRIAEESEEKEHKIRPVFTVSYGNT